MCSSATAARVEKFIGDAVVALFGAPVAHEDDPERRSGPASRSSAAIAALNEEDPARELQVRDRRQHRRGDRRRSAPGRRRRRAWPWGDVLNTAARLQSAAPVNGVLVDERTYRACGDAIEFETPSRSTAKGKAEPVPVWDAVRVRRSPGRAAGRARRSSAGAPSSRG